MLLWGGTAVKEATGEKYLCSHELIECFNLSTSEWNQRRGKAENSSDLPHPCCGARIAVIHDRDIYQFGGLCLLDGRRVFPNDVHKLDGLTLHWQRILPNNQSTPVGRSSHGLCILGEKGNEHLVMMGGYGINIVFPTPESQSIPHSEDPDLGLNNEVWLFSLQTSE